MKKRISALLLAMLCLMMNVCLSMSNEAKADLDKELAQMIGETGTKVPGLGVIAFKDGKEVYSKKIPLTCRIPMLKIFRIPIA